MIKKNCWEFHECGREPNGLKVDEMGVCPAAETSQIDGVNGGINGGRACWAVAGTFCDGEIQGSYSQKLQNCMSCDFYKLVIYEEGDNYEGIFSILSTLRL